MRLVTFHYEAGDEPGAPDHRVPDYRVAVVLDGGRVLPLSALALITPSLNANFGRMGLADIVARDPDFARIREALALAAGAVNLWAKLAWSAAAAVMLRSVAASSFSSLKALESVSA